MVLSIEMRYLFLFLASSFAWSPDSWKTIPTTTRISQIPVYKNQTHCDLVLNELRTRPPLVFAGEIRRLRRDIAMAHRGEAFVLQAGPCAESIRTESSVNEIKNLYSLIVKMSIILSYGLEKKIVRIGRVAGQYAKPRSQMLENDNSTLTFRGDILHSLTDREPDPERLREAYVHSVSTLNTIRSFAKSGDLDLQNIEQWMSPISVQHEYFRYRNMEQIIRRSLLFVQNCGVTEDSIFREPEFSISHECLLLPYEECFVRREDSTGLWYHCGAHTVWLGERTRNLTGVHVEFLRGIENPIGIKVGPSTDPDDLLSICRRLNPKNSDDKIMLIARMGNDMIIHRLPPIMKAVRDSGQNVVWIVDPCHGNTRQIEDSKTRFLSDILNEILKFFEVCRQEGCVPGGLHLELSGERHITECVGQNITKHVLKDRYESLIDPRLNYFQSLETAFFVTEL
jgi:3-deoxy-7-phosphoheptulonate synthase